MNADQEACFLTVGYMGTCDIDLLNHILIICFYLMFIKEGYQIYVWRWFTIIIKAGNRKFCKLTLLYLFLPNKA